MKSYDNPPSREHQEGGGSLSPSGDLVIEPIKIERELFPHGDPEYLKNPYLGSTMHKLSGQSKYDRTNKVFRCEEFRGCAPVMILTD
jgi:hypothetical protein